MNANVMSIPNTPADVPLLTRVATPSDMAANGRPGEDSPLDEMIRHMDVRKTAFIPVGLTIRGELDTDGAAAVVIFGVVNGAVRAGDKPVIVMEGGHVTGPIVTEGDVIVAGTVGEQGREQMAVTTGQRFHLAETGAVHGDVTYRSLRIYEGGIIAGRMVPHTSPN